MSLDRKVDSDDNLKEEAKIALSDEATSETYTLPGFPGGLPKKWIVSEESKQLFERGRLDQGYAVVVWPYRDEEKKRRLCV